MKKPTKSILDRSFVYVPSTATSVDQTWRRFGWRPSSETTSAVSGSAHAAAATAPTTVQ